MKAKAIQKPRRQPHEMSALTGRLRRESLKITGPRAAILAILSASPSPLTNKQILAAMPIGQCDLATVYRSMHLLEKMRMVKRCHFHDGSARFELIAEGDDGHHHHLICTRCAQVVEIQECFPVELEKQIATENGYENVTHKLEFFGVCPACRG